MTIAFDAPILLTRTLRAHGLDEHGLRLAVRRGELVRLTRGAYTNGARWRRLSVTDRYRLRCVGHVAAARVPLVLSHQSAAAVLGLPLVHADLTQLHYSVPEERHGKHSPTLRRHSVPLPYGSIIQTEGLWTTSAARTLADLLSSTGMVTGVAAADHALRLGLCSRDDVIEAAAARDLRRGGRRLRSALDFATPLAESPGESLSRVRMLQLGLPQPVLQHPWKLRDGRTVYSDFWWPDAGLIGEFDGVAKYVRHEYAGRSTPAELVVNEKKREDALRALGPRVARWGWDTANDAQAFAAHLAASGLRPTLPTSGSPPRR